MSRHEIPINRCLNKWENFDMGLFFELSSEMRTMPLSTFLVIGNFHGKVVYLLQKD